MTTYEAVDCQSFAGGFTLGMARVGFDIVAKREAEAGFGIPLVRANLSKFNGLKDDAIHAVNPRDWEARRAPVTFGNPPCSGFSGYTRVNNTLGGEYGHHHPINQCMWDLVEYAAKNKSDIVVMESVDLAYTAGRDLMLALRDDMSERMGRNYTLTHLRHDNGAIGGNSRRRRYFMVLSRVPFGIEEPTPNVTRLDEFLYDLENLPLKFGPQAYKRKAKDPHALRARAGVTRVTGHDTIDNPETRAIRWAAEFGDWRCGEHIGDAVRRGIERVGIKRLPEEMFYGNDRGNAVKKSLLTTDAYSSRRWHGHGVAGVITGTGIIDVVHPTLPRNLTYRETARIMGFPDDFDLSPMYEGTNVSGAKQKMLGKGISVPCGEFVGTWVKAALDRSPGSYRGEKMDDREYLIDVKDLHKPQVAMLRLEAPRDGITCNNKNQPWRKA